MEFDKTRVYSEVNADELHVGDKVICANDMGHLKHYVTSDGAVLELQSVLDENNRARFVAGAGKVLFNLAYLIERAENCTNCRLCKGSIKDDPTKVCENYEAQDVPPANCETCSKADTDRCPVPNPPKRTGCCHWEPKPARVCENCRNLERHGKDNNWCEVREFKLSDEAIKKNTCEYLKLVNPKTEQKAEKHLCDTCKDTYPECPAIAGDIKFGNGKGNDNVIECRYYKKKKHLRPFNNTDELVKVWCEKGGKWQKRELTMPYIWVRRKEANSKGQLITEFGDELFVGIGRGEAYNMTDLLVPFTFLDGSPCGVEA